MKYFFSIVFLFFLVFTIKANNILAKPSDTTIHQRFIMHILQEYELEGRWILVRMDSVNVYREVLEVVQPQIIYNSLSENFSELSRKSFIQLVYELLSEEEAFALDPRKEHPIRGKNVRPNEFKTLYKLPLSDFLSKYFDSDNKLKETYCNLLYEIIAVCYVNNIQVITPTGGRPYYKIFK